MGAISFLSRATTGADIYARYIRRSCPIGGFANFKPHPALHFFVHPPVYIYIRNITHRCESIHYTYIRSIVLKNRCQSVISKYHECMYVHGVPSPLPPPCACTCTCVCVRLSRCNLPLHDVANLAHARFSNPSFLPSPANFYCLFYCPPSLPLFFLRSLLFLFFFVSASSRISYMNIGIGPSLNSSLEFKLREKYSAVFLFFFLSFSFF